VQIDLICATWYSQNNLQKCTEHREQHRDEEAEREECMMRSSDGKIHDFDRSFMVNGMSDTQPRERNHIDMLTRE
jgi:hypothetical protein